MESNGAIPTREEHHRYIRGIWRRCFILATGVLLFAGGVMAVLFLLGYEPRRVVEGSTGIFQVVVLTYGMGFFVPAFLTSLQKMSLGVEMSRKGLEIGEQTVENLKKFEEKVEPILSDLKSVIGAVKGLVDDLKKQDIKSIIEFIDKLKRDGTAEKIAVSLEEIGTKVGNALDRVKREAVSREIENI